MTHRVYFVNPETFLFQVEEPVQLTESQEALMQELLDIGTENNFNMAPYLTKLGTEFETANALAVPAEHLLDLEQTLLSTGTMAANNLQACESRRARCEGDTRIDYPEFTWQPEGTGTSDERVADVADGLDALAVSVNATPPDPPTGDEDAA